MNKSDLHIHSKFSNDGEYKITDIINKCIKNNIFAFSITDHNSTGGISEASSESSQKNIKFIPGIEIDCKYKGTDLHLLGYNIDWKSRDFFLLEKDVAGKVMTAFTEMIRNLNDLGFNVKASDVLKKAEGQLPSGELIAEVMLAEETPDIKLQPYMPGGERSDMPYLNFYLDYFAQGKPAYVKIEYMDYSSAVDMVRANGGIPIIAHPGLNFKEKENIVEELLIQGADGLEVFNNYHDINQINFFAELVLKQKKLMTCGSDFHGKTKPVIDIGNYRFDDKYTDYLNNSVNTLIYNS